MAFRHRQASKIVLGRLLNPSWLFWAVRRVMSSRFNKMGGLLMPTS